MNYLKRSLRSIVVFYLVSLSIQFVCLDTEESQRGGSKPVTNAGILASKWAKEYFGANVKIISFDPQTEQPEPKEGIVGFQRQILATSTWGSEFSETILASVSTELAHEELPKIWNDCQKLPD